MAFFKRQSYLTMLRKRIILRNLRAIVK